MLQRIYGTAWESRKELDAHLEKIAQIEARDHRKLIKQLDLVSFHEEAGAGLAYWHPKGGRMRVIIEDYWRKLHYEGGTRSSSPRTSAAPTCGRPRATSISTGTGCMRR